MQITRISSSSFICLKLWWLPRYFFVISQEFDASQLYMFFLFQPAGAKRTPLESGHKFLKPNEEPISRSRSRSEFWLRLLLHCKRKLTSDSCRQLNALLWPSCAVTTACSSPRLSLTWLLPVLRPCCSWPAARGRSASLSQSSQSTCCWPPSWCARRVPAR